MSYKAISAMICTITANKHIDDYFIEWLIDRIRFEILGNIDEEQLNNFNSVVNQQQLFKRVDNRNIKFDIRKAIVMSLQNIRYRKIKNVYIIEISSDTIYPHYLVKLSTLCKLLNYGNVNIKGYPIYTEAFTRVKSNLRGYYKQYLME